MSGVEKLLIVDDDEDIRLVSEFALRRIADWEVSLAATGEEALARAGEERPDVILLDVMMAPMDGPTTLAKLREEPRTAGIPVIFLTAKVQGHDLERYRELGAIGVIGKPFDVMTLADEIRDLVGGGAAPDVPDDEFADLREAFRRKLPARLAELDETLRVARREGGPEAVARAHRLAHTLKGTSGSYGLDAVCAEMERVEERLEDLAATPDAGSARLWDEVEGAVLRAQRRLAEDGG